MAFRLAHAYLHISDDVIWLGDEVMMVFRV